MFHYILRLPRRFCAGLSLTLALLSSGSLRAAPPTADGSTGLRQLFELAWSRQPEAHSQSLRQDANNAKREASESWLAGPPALEFSSKGDQLHGNGGTREHIAGISAPIWLPNEKSHASALVSAEQQALNTRILAAQLRTAGLLRDSYWQWQRALLETQLNQERQKKAHQLAADVALRVKAGDLARIDQHQAEALATQASIELEAARTALAAASQKLQALTGRTLQPPKHIRISAEPLPPDFKLQEARHPQLQTLAAQADVARSQAALTRVQTRANPELSLSTTSERDDSSDHYQGSLTLGIRIPLGSDSRNRAKNAQAQADALEADTLLALAKDQAAAEREAALQRFENAHTQQQLAAKRLQLVQESLGFIEKSFRLGESDLPTRLRAERDAIEARQQAAMAQLELAAATSALRQALGLLPE